MTAESRPAPALVTLSPLQVAVSLGICVLALLAAHTLAVYLIYAHDMDYAKGFIPLFYLNMERSAPAFFSSSLFLVGALGFFLMHRTADSGRQWLVLSVVFVFLAADEAAGIHELLIHPVRDLLGTSGIFYYAWVVPYGIGVLALAAYVGNSLFRLPTAERSLFVLSGIVYVTGALGLEMLGGLYLQNKGITFTLIQSRDIGFELITTAEEILEMTGLVLAIFAQARLLRRRGRDMVLRVI